jgi:hypothetical protein
MSSRSGVSAVAEDHLDHLQPSTRAGPHLFIDSASSEQIKVTTVLDDQHVTKPGAQQKEGIGVWDQKNVKE